MNGWALVRHLAAAAALATCAHPSPSIMRRDAGAAGATAHGGACRWASPPVPFYRSADTLYQVWTLPAARAAGPWRAADAPALTAFRDAVAGRLARAGLSADPASVTRRVTAYYGARADGDAQRDADNGRRVLSGTVGAIRPLACIEALVLDYQARRFSMTRRPTEFHAFLLRRGDPAGADTPMLVYFAASGAPWPPSVGRLTDSLERRTRDGWQVVAHVHNHPFYLDQLRADSAGQPTADIAGGMAPSSTDVQFYRAMRARLGLASARVTNGFATLELPAADFGRLRARGDTSGP